MAKKADLSIYLFGIKLNGIPRQRLLSSLQRNLSFQAKSKTQIIYTLNPEQIVLAQTNDRFRHVVMQSTWNLVDGVGLAWAVRFLRAQKLERIPGVDLAADLVKYSTSQNLPVMFIGARPGVATQAAKSFKATNTSLIFATHGYQDINHPTVTETTQLFKQMAAHKPALVIVGWGAPHQEIWIHQHYKKLDQLGVKIAMVAGGSFDLWSGQLTRAPRSVRSLGLEWLWRLIQQPWRWRRQLRLVRFVALVMREKFRGGR